MSHSQYYNEKTKEKYNEYLYEDGGNSFAYYFIDDHPEPFATLYDGCDILTNESKYTEPQNEELAILIRNRYRIRYWGREHCPICAHFVSDDCEHLRQKSKYFVCENDDHEQSY